MLATMPILRNTHSKTRTESTGKDLKAQNMESSQEVRFTKSPSPTTITHNNMLVGQEPRSSADLEATAPSRADGYMPVPGSSEVHVTRSAIINVF